MICKLNHQDEQIAKNIQQIQQQAYRIEAEMMGFYGIPQLHEPILEIQHSTEIFIGFNEEQLQGVISYQVEEGLIDIHRLVVAPCYFRKGVAKQLIEYVLRNYRDMNSSLVPVLQTNRQLLFIKRLVFKKNG
ncbi:GNAT family N-acetyltransferase [Planococcus faecalis]|uniref:GNAT family N-acetyltransferase n=1 Tax=Planococcus faecalis TaxID=1598147 RepID=UPI002108832C|nr:GNAT family N-acetyltransferase [Planococcus faecalis]